MIRTDKWLHENSEKLGINPDHINPASVDVCLGNEIIEYIYDPQYEMERTVTYNLKPDQEFKFIPGRFYLCHTKEYTKIPSDHCAQLILKSSSGRKGLDHAHSGWGDPGFHGQWTFEFVAHRPVVFKEGQRIAQLVFVQCDSVPNSDYTVTGRYNGQTNVQTALEDGNYATSGITRGMETNLE